MKTKKTKKADRKKKIVPLKNKTRTPARQKSNKNCGTIKKFARFHAFLTLLTFLTYVTAGVLFDPGLIAKDLQRKYAWAATIAVSAWVTGPPEKPVATASSSCRASTPFILIDWEATADTETYDIYRNGELLVSDIILTFYEDVNVNVGSEYAYYIVSSSPLGETTSDEVRKSVEACYIHPPPPPPPPTCHITTLDKISLLTYICQPKTNKRKPFFAGTTNIASARIIVEISSPKLKRKIISQITTNGNGYWSWKNPVRLKKKYYTITVSVSDPTDSGRTASAAMRFRVVGKLSKKELKRCQQRTGYQSLSAQSIAPPHYPTLPQFELFQPEKFFYSGKKINLKLTTADKLSNQALAAPMSYAIVDEKNKNVFQIASISHPPQNGSPVTSLRLPRYLADGKYTLRASSDWNGNYVSSEQTIEVKERPPVVFGNIQFKRSEIISRLGWLAIGSSILLCIFFLLMTLEYRLTRKANHFIDEDELKYNGFID